MAIGRASERAFLFLRQEFRAIARDFPFWRAQVFILLQNSADLVAKWFTVIDQEVVGKQDFPSWGMAIV